MKKIILVVLLICSPFLAVNAQEKDSNLTSGNSQNSDAIKKKSVSFDGIAFGIDVGGIFPQGDFVSRDLESDSAGAANLGYGIEIYLKDKTKTYLDVFRVSPIVTLALSVNPFDSEFAKQSFLGDFNLSSLGDTEYKASSKVGKYTLLSLLVGYELVVFDSSIVHLSLNAMLGATYATSPKIEESIEFPSISASAKNSISSANAATLMVRVGVTTYFKLTEKMRLATRIHYASAKPEFKLKSTYTSVNSGRTQVEGNPTYRTSVLHEFLGVTLGVVYSL